MNAEVKGSGIQRRHGYGVGLSPSAVAGGSMGLMAATRSTRSTASVSRTVALATATVGAAAAIGLVFGTAMYVFLHLPTPTPAPPCPQGTSLYTRSVVLGKVLVPVQHCFRDTDAQDGQP